MNRCPPRVRTMVGGLGKAEMGARQGRLLRAIGELSGVRQGWLKENGGGGG